MCYLSIICIFFNDIFFLFKSPGTGINLATSNLSTLLFKLLKLVGTFFSLSIPNLSTLDFKLAKSTFLTLNQHFLDLFLLHN